uniref:Uncharacterized protein n=1 Tax=Klebsiella oxytoca TaxID=571 RepID=A0A345WXB8_KLEOX|nr:hypothetical protein [Klebsiella oxytoca]
MVRAFPSGKTTVNIRFHKAIKIIWAPNNLGNAPSSSNANKHIVTTNTPIMPTNEHNIAEIPKPNAANTIDSLAFNPVAP